MTFIETIEKAGLNLATEIFKKSSGEDFEDNLSFADWFGVIQAVQKRSGAGRIMTCDIARKRLVPLAKTYSEWATTFYETDYQFHDNPDKRDQMFNYIFGAITSIEEMKRFITLIKPESPDTYSRFILAVPEKALRLATIPADWSWLIDFTPACTKEVRSICLENLEKSASTFDDWLFIYEKSGRKEEVHKKAFQKLVELSK